MMLNNPLERESVKKKTLDQTLALAGVFQAARMVDSIAHRGSVPESSYKESINSLFNLDPSSVNDVYSEDHAAQLGLDIIEQVLSQEKPGQYAETIRYTLALIHLEKMLSRKTELLSTIRKRVETSKGQIKHFDSSLHSAIISKLACIYVDTLGTFRFRIQVRGNANYLQNPINTDRVRASLLAGIRSAMLWRQLGGRRWQLFFNRSKLLQAAHELNRQDDRIIIH